MRERIVFAPSVRGTDLLRNLALHGQNCFNLRICGSAELARLALMRSGIPVTEDFLDSKEETALIAGAAEGVKYFGKTTYSDIQAIAGSIRVMRCLITDDSEEQSMIAILSKGQFAEKNDALLLVYHNYLQALSEKRVLDSVGIIRKAIRECRPMDSEFLILDEYPLNPLETALISKLSGGQFSSVSIRQLYNVPDTKIKTERFLNCYGAPNEVETILADIYSGKKLDQCTVAVTDPQVYGQLFFDYALLYNLPVTFGCGIPVTNSNPARLLMLYYRWLTSGFFGADALKEMLSSEAFSLAALKERLGTPEEGFSWGAFFDVLGGLRFTNDLDFNRKRVAQFRNAVEEEKVLFDGNEENKEYRTFLSKLRSLPFLEIMAEELALPTEEFIRRYSYLRKGGATEAENILTALDLSASRAICDELAVIRRSGITQTAEDVLLNILKNNVCVQSSAEGRLHVTNINDALTSVRKHLYIAGLSAAKYPGSPKENYLLLDADLLLFGEKARMLTANERIQRKKDRLMSLARLATSLGSEVYVSYSGMNVSELKRENASSLIFELFREEHGADVSVSDLESAIVKTDYFEPAISPARLIGRAYNDGQEILQDSSREPAAVQPVGWNLDREYSPSALGTFFNCPREFMLKYILRIPEPEETDPFEVISAADLGSLAHSLMECLANSHMELDEFLRLADVYFDRFLSNKPPLIAEKAGAAKEQFREMMETAYEMDPHRETLLKEEEIHCVHETGVRIHGYPDRVEKKEDGSCLVADFKSGNSIAHVKDDIDTCLQVVIYAYLMEQRGYKVSGGEFRYIRRGETVTCKYDDDMKKELSEKLAFFRDSLISGDFPVAEKADNGPDPCRYCKYGKICGRIEKEGADE